MGPYVILGANVRKGWPFLTASHKIINNINNYSFFFMEVWIFKVGSYEFIMNVAFNPYMALLATTQ